MSVTGITVVEHNLPVTELYDDVLTLFALSGSGSTPTHIVNYGGELRQSALVLLSIDFPIQGPFGEQWLWATEDIPNDEKYVCLRDVLVPYSDHDRLF